MRPGDDHGIRPFGRRVKTPSSSSRAPVPRVFGRGLWHGIVAPITFIVSLFADGVRIYETNNNGRWYDFGFMLGIGAYASNHEIRQGVLGTPR
jgi:hypothetical protein